MKSEMLKRTKDILNEVFGYKNFRPLQKEIIASVLAKQNSLVVMPTGGGKSVCYQIPALIFDGITVVVSPLISLMKDQVDQMQQLGIEAILLNSSISRDRYNSNLDIILKGKAKLLYVAPETLLKNEVLSLLSSVRVDCIAIDEAHCISEWGHDFRPEYRLIASVRKKFPDAVCIALTATATERVRNDIIQSLKLDNSSKFIASFNRENLFYCIAPKNDPLGQTLEFLQKYKNESGIIYTFSRDSVDRLYESLKNKGYSVKPYHAGLSDKERCHNQELFLQDDVKIIVATIAFGMGIHKTNVRFVVHFDLPKSIESYYQETGRAGRDGVKSTCLLLFSYADIGKIRYFIDQKTDETEKNVAVAQLNAIINYADAHCCRRVPLLEYFGEEYAGGGCGMCDNCVTPPVFNDDVTIQAQMFLSCIKRSGERFGAGHIIDILRGSRSKKIEDFGHCNLSTYGIGKNISKKMWQNLSRQFIQSKLIFQDMENYGILKITEKGYGVMKGLESVMGNLSEINTSSATSSGERDYDNGLFEILRNKRKEIAYAENVPPYVIFSDKTLIAISTIYPQSSESLISIHGIGSRKIEKYGDIIIKIVKKYVIENEINVGQVFSAVSKKREYLKKPRHIQIGEMYNSGMSILELEEREGVKRKTILSNLYKYAKEGFVLKSQGLVAVLPENREILSDIIDAFEKLGSEYLKPVFEELGKNIDYETLEICRLYYSSRE